MEITYSGISAATMMVDVGYPKQSIRVAVSFSPVAETLLFVPEICSAFVPRCYEPQASLSSVRERLASPQTSLLGFNWTDRIFDAIWIGGVERFQIIEAFEVRRLRPGHSLLRDVAGMVRISRRDSFLANQTLVFEKAANLTTLIRTLETGDDQWTTVSPIRLQSPDRWTFQARRLRLGALWHMEPTCIDFDPSTAVVLLPESFRENVMSVHPQFTVNQRGSIFGPCDLPFVIRMDFNSRRIPSVSVLVPRELLESDSPRDVCAFLLTFVPINCIVVGASVLETVAKVIVDNSSIRFVQPDIVRSITPWSFPVFVPVFNSPETVTWDDGDVLLRFERSNDGIGYILSSATPAVIQKTGEVFFEFIPTRFSSFEIPEPSIFGIFHYTFHDLEDEDDLWFDLQRLGSGRKYLVALDVATNDGTERLFLRFLPCGENVCV